MASTAIIKSISVRSFKSFGANTQTFNFNKGFNLIVGANGSGKSNILDAICFALCTKLSSLRVQHISELQSTDTKETCEVSLDLLISGGLESGQVFHLDVKILPSDSRQYKVNGKLKTMKEVKELLQHLGLALEDNSAIIHQSQVTELSDNNSAIAISSIISAASGAGRWNDEVDKANQEIKGIKIGLREIEENISLLESSIEEDNNRIQALSKARKLEDDICILSRQLHKFQAEMLESTNNEIRKKQQSFDLEEAKLKQNELLLERKRSDFTKLKSSLSTASFAHLDTERGSLLDKIAMLEEEINENEAKLTYVKDGSQNLHHYELLCQKLHNKIAFTKETLEANQGRLDRLELVGTSKFCVLANQINSYVEELKDCLELAEEKLQDLDNQQKLIFETLNNINIQKTLRENYLRCAEDEHVKISEKVDMHSSASVDSSIQLEKYKQQRENLRKTIDQIDIRIQLMEAQMGNLNPSEESIPRAQPLHSCFSFKQYLDDSSFYLLAMNVIAGSLKKICVTETTNDAVKLLRIYRNESLEPTRFSRIWPLDRLRLETDRYNQHKSVQKKYPDKAVILPLDLLEYDLKFATAMKRVFGGYVISSSDDVATDLIVKHKIFNVTLDGKVNRPGSVTGGWHNNSKNSYLHIKFSRDKAVANTNLLKIQLSEIDMEAQQLQQALYEFEESKRQRDELLQNIQRTQKEIENLSKEEDKQKVLLEECESLSAHTLKEREFSRKQLEDANRVDQSDDILMKAVMEMKEVEMDLLNSLNSLNQELEDAEISRRRWTEKIQDFDSLDALTNTIQNDRKELKILTLKLGEIDKALIVSEEEEKKRSEEVVRERKVIESISQSVSQAKEEILKIQKSLHQLRNEEQRRVEEELQSLFNFLKACNVNLETSATISSLHDECNNEAENESIKDMQQYLTFKRSLKNMVTELKEIMSKQEQVSLDEEVAIKEKVQKLELFKERKESIEDSIRILSEGIGKTKKKVEEANETTFQIIRESFIKCCSLLVPNKLVDLIKTGQQVEDGIKMAFSNSSNSKGPSATHIDWKTNLSELSGGQRSLLSLALILMVAKRGQSPVYLMDEVDAALDEQNQERIAKLIQSFSKEGIQIICVSHNISFQQHAETILEVSRVNGSTTLQQTHVVKN